MSIRSEIIALVGTQQLIPYRPRGRKPSRRRVFLTPEAVKRLHDPNSAICLLVGRGFIEAALTRWVLGELVWRRRKGSKWVGGFLFRLSNPPIEIWEMRVIEPPVQARLFCRFAEPDTLIMSGMNTRGMLGKKGSVGWRTAMTDCENSWARNFPNTSPFIGMSIHDYVTENCDDFEL